MPEYVSAPSYPTPSYDQFGRTLGGLANTYRQGQQANMLVDQQQAFKDGLPMTPQGQPDYARIMSVLAQKGDVNSISTLGPILQDQQMLNQGGVVSPLFSGASYAPASAPRQPVGDLPPASAAGATSTQRPAGGVSIDGAAKIPDGSNVFGVANAVIQDPTKRAKAADMVERILGVEPDQKLTPEQAARARRILENVASAGGVNAGGGYAEPVKVGVTPPSNLAFKDSVQDLQQDAGDLGVPTQMISGQRDSAEQAVLRARYEAGQGNVAARPGQSLHERGEAADVVASGPGGQQRLIEMAREPWRNLQPGADFGDPNHFQAAGAGSVRAAPQAVAGGQGGGRPIVPQVPLPKGFTDPQQAILAIDQEIARLSPNRYAAGQVQALTDWRNRIATSTAPMEVRPGQTIVDPRDGSVRFQAPLTNSNALAMQRFLEENPNATATEIQAFQRASQAPRSGIGMFIQRFQEEHPGATSEEVMRAVQEYTGGNAGATVLGKRTVGLELAENEAAALIPAVKAASDAVSRTQYPTLNSVIMAASQGTGGEDVIRLGIAVESLTQAYARALSPTGSPIAADKAHAHELLNKAWSQGQINAALDQMQKEIDRAQASLAKTVADRRRGGPAPAEREAASAPAAAPNAGAGKAAGGLPSGWTVEVH